MARPITEEGDERVYELQLPLMEPPARVGLTRRLGKAPLFQIAVYYAVMLLIAALLIDHFPLVRRALITPAVPVLTEGAALITGDPSPENWTAAPAIAAATSERALTTLLIVCAAIALAVPVAWIYMLTKRMRFDPGLVRSVVILPIAVAGILLVVKNSLAIAFSLAGIVAAVRFRNTLKDPRDAVYIFLTIAIGIAAGVQALDVALVVSFVFNVTVLVLWKFQIGSIHGGRYGRTGVLSLGDPSLLVARTPEASDSVRGQIVQHAEDLEVDGLLLVHTTEPELTRHAVVEALRQTASDWRALGMVSRGGELGTLQYLVDLKKKSEAADLLGALDEWASHIAAAEFIPFHRRRAARPEENGDDDDDDD